MSSITCLDEKPSKQNVSQNASIENNLDLPEVVSEEQNVSEKPSASGDAVAPNDGPKASNDPRFLKFFKMIQFGVPLPAVKLKMETEGLDSSVLE